MQYCIETMKPCHWHRLYAAQARNMFDYKSRPDAPKNPRLVPRSASLLTQKLNRLAPFNSNSNAIGWPATDPRLDTSPHATRTFVESKAVATQPPGRVPSEIILEHTADQSGDIVIKMLIGY